MTGAGNSSTKYSNASVKSSFLIASSTSSNRSASVFGASSIISDSSATTGSSVATSASIEAGSVAISPAVSSGSIISLSPLILIFERRNYLLWVKRNSRFGQK